MHTLRSEADSLAPAALAEEIKSWGQKLGFQAIGIGGIDLGHTEERLQIWLEQDYHGDMDYMAKHGSKRSHPDKLVPGTLSILSARMNYVLPDLADAASILNNPDRAYISRYALGRDYHKLMRQRLKQLAERIQLAIGPYHYRVFTDSAPVMETAIAAQAGIGWRGKHTLLLSREAGSLFFLGEIYTDLPLPADAPQTAHCGDCRRCLDICPTQAIVAPYQVDARRCISYLTIELKGSLPAPLRPLIGNRVYGCDDCQLVCPWNKFAQVSDEADFAVRHGLDRANLTELFAWSEAEFLHKMAGSAIYRIGYEQWLRNLAVGLGNAPPTAESLRALQRRQDHPSALVREHVAWALAHRHR
ncbi:MAG: tRNA epoxyqueuosine(34) reductase QueG [Sulfuricellaceae bacterium]|nr:tRNA epoxyqueuosine(34) reductase QueG [Sulfuricellaceae bacterium]